MATLVQGGHRARAEEELTQSPKREIAPGTRDDERRGEMGLGEVLLFYLAS